MANKEWRKPETGETREGVRKPEVRIQKQEGARERKGEGEMGSRIVLSNESI